MYIISKDFKSESKVVNRNKSDFPIEIVYFYRIFN